MLFDIIIQNTVISLSFFVLGYWKLFFWTEFWEACGCVWGSHISSATALAISGLQQA